jgi:hypothetical protein
MNSPDLATQVVSRVKTMNFGAKEGVQTVTISYPIDFLPAAGGGECCRRGRRSASAIARSRENDRALG